MNKVIIKPNQKVKVGKDVLDVLDNAKATPIPEILNSVLKEKVCLAYLRSDTGHLISGLSFLEDNKIIIGITPNPIDIYFGIAYTFLNNSSRVLEEIRKQKEDENLGCILINDNSLNAFLQFRISCIIMLHSTVEAFINSIVPETCTYSKTVKENGEKVTKSLVKEEIERLNFTEKFKSVIKSITNLDFETTNQALYISILNLNKLRNELIHLKSIKDGKKENYIMVYVDVIKADLKKYMDDVKEYVNTILPNTIEFTNVSI